MSLRLVIESSPTPQVEMERLYDGGQLIIGRSDEADWQLDDPNMFLSRRHVILTEEGGQVMATDASSGGLFIDNASSPVGTGNSVPVEPGMRLHLGDFVLRLEAAGAAMPEVPSTQGQPKPGVGFSFEFGAPPPEEKPVERPQSLPDPFGLQKGDAVNERHKEVQRTPRPLDQEDPFGLDLRAAFSDEEPADKVLPFPEKDSGGYFGASPKPAAPAKAPEEPPAKPDIFGDWEKPAAPRAAGPAEEGPPEVPPMPPQDAPHTEAPGMALFENFNLPRTTPPPSVLPPLPEERMTDIPQPDIPPGATDPGAFFTNAPEDTRMALPQDSEQPDAAAPPLNTPRTTTPTEAPAPVQRTAAAMRSDDDLRAALLRGMGLDPADMPTEDAAAEMERLGRSMRDMVEGVMFLLRTRAQEKQKVRVAQTIIASADVNPLKFLATPEDACAALMKPRGKGYLPPEQAVQGAFRDLADHQVRTWTALQTSLRRMIDTFDPAEIEKEMQDVGMLESLIAGGRSAKLWQLYEERYREIATSAEKQFLGDVGADFRDAYENKGS